MKTLKITIASLLFSSISFLSHGQNTEGVKIGSDVSPPAPSAMLEIESSSKGVLIPRVDILDLNTEAPVTNPEESLLVYNTNTTTGKGYYYWNGTKWVRLGSVGSQIPKVTFAEMLSMRTNLTDADLGMQVYVTTRIADIPAETINGPAISANEPNVATEGLWYFSRDRYCSPGVYLVKIWKKIEISNNAPVFIQSPIDCSGAQ